jgi:hypothetical protein
MIEIAIDIPPSHKSTEWIVQLTPVHDPSNRPSRPFAPSPVQQGRFTVHGNPGEFFWSLLPSSS